MALDCSPIGDLGFGVRIEGVTYDGFRDGIVAKLLRDALADHGLVVLAEVDADHRFQERVGEIYGPLKDYSGSDMSAASAAGTGSIAEMVTDPKTCTLVEIAGERLAGWMPWHFDQCYNSAPNGTRVLRCGQVVASGGLTGFIDGAELYELMDSDLREQIETCNIRYSLRMAYADLRFGRPAHFRIVRQAAGAGASGADEPTRSADHPAVRVLPDGRKALHVSPWMSTGIAGRMDADGDALLEAIAAEINRLGASIAYFHRWTPNDIVIWDNLRMLHASSGFEPTQTRIMYRTTVQSQRTTSAALGSSEN